MRGVCPWLGRSILPKESKISVCKADQFEELPEGALPDTLCIWYILRIPDDEIKVRKGVGVKLRCRTFNGAFGDIKTIGREAKMNTTLRTEG
jgi:hypothetical protein